MKPERITALVDRCEAATEGQQDKLLMDAWYEAFGHGSPTGGHKEWMERRAAFVRMLNVKAYESAALTLVPDGMIFNMRKDWFTVEGPCGAAIKGPMPSDMWLGRAKTLGLAIGSAALRARAA